MAELMKKRPLFNPDGDTDVRLRRLIGGNTTNLNDFNNMKDPRGDQSGPGCEGLSPPLRGRADRL